MTAMTPKFGMGASVLRLEDDAFITGRGRYTDDVAPEGVLHAYVLRSPMARARFKIGDLEAARSAPGVHLVMTAADVAHLKALKAQAILPGADGKMPKVRDIPLLCADEVAYVGDAVAFVVADTRALAQDAADLIEIDYEPEEAVTSTASARCRCAGRLARQGHQPRLRLQDG
jgi:aerobic carbon-monoxide dehydrogenase large subunit